MGHLSAVGIEIPPRAQSQLLVVDAQERLMPAMNEAAAFGDALALLLQGAGLFRIPASISEQYVAGLGPSIAPIQTHCPDSPRFEKFAFSAARQEKLDERIDWLRAAQGRDHLIIAGIEAHVCVLLSALDFQRQGLAVTVAADAVTSRSAVDRAHALRALSRAGVAVLPVETLLFGWCETAQDTDFKILSKLLKARNR